VKAARLTRLSPAAYWTRGRCSPPPTEYLSHSAARGSAVGYNLRLILAWLKALLCLILTALTQAFTIRSVLK
jgi:hypothetical protein